MEDITDEDYMHARRVYKDFKRNNLGINKEYHDFHVQSDKLFLADVLENFWEMCLEYTNSSLHVFLLCQD